MAGELLHPEIYVLEGEGVSLTYRSEVAGGPLLRYSGPAFPGGRGPGTAPVELTGEVGPLKIEIGTIVSMDLVHVPDLVSFTLTLLLPDVNLGGLDPGFGAKTGPPSRHGAQPVATHVIYTATATTLGGPGFVRGQIHTYAVLPVKGTARLAATPTGIKEISLTLDQFNGYGYTVSFRQDGTATDTRRRDRLPDQHFIGSVELSEFDDLAGLLERSGFFALDAQYGENPPLARTVVKREGVEKSVSNFGDSGPAELQMVEAAIESIRSRVAWRPKRDPDVPNPPGPDPDTAAYAARSIVDVQEDPIPPLPPPDADGGWGTDPDSGPIEPHPPPVEP